MVLDGRNETELQHGVKVVGKRRVHRGQVTDSRQVDPAIDSGWITVFIARFVTLEPALNEALPERAAHCQQGIHAHLVAITTRHLPQGIPGDH